MVPLALDFLERGFGSQIAGTHFNAIKIEKCETLPNSKTLEKPYRTIRATLVRYPYLRSLRSQVLYTGARLGLFDKFTDLIKANKEPGEKLNFAENAVPFALRQIHSRCAPIVA